VRQEIVHLSIQHLGEGGVLAEVLAKVGQQVVRWLQRRWCLGSRWRIGRLFHGGSLCPLLPCEKSFWRRLFTFIKAFGALGVFPQERLRFDRFIASQKKSEGFVRSL
jgi:hypothetical protein